MKYTLLALSLVMGLTTSAQHQDNDFDFSVFSEYKAISPVSKEAMMQTQEQVKSKFPGWNVNVDKLTSQFNDIYGDAVNIPGNTVEEKVVNCFNAQLKDLGIDKAEWQQTRNIAAPHASYVNYVQYLDGHKVVFSDLGFRFTKGGKLVRIKMSAFGKPAANTAVLMDKQRVLGTSAFNADFAAVSISSKELGPDWVWFPVPTPKGYELKQAYEFSVNGVTSTNFPLELKGYVDAVTGDLLYRVNEVHDAMKIVVKSDSIYKDNRTVPVSTEPLADLRIDIDNNQYNVDDTGAYSNSSMSAPKTANIILRGKWARVRTNGGDTPDTSINITTGDTVFTYPATSPASIRHVNAYYHITRVHDFMRKHLTNFTGLDVEATVNVDVPGTTCNAFYSNNNTSMNFYAEGGGCISFAEIGDVSYHEYGHGISYKFYSANGANFNNSALGEGNSDIWALSITRDSVLGRNKGTNAPTSYIRRYDQGAVVFPLNVNGEEHNDGEIIAGCWWYVSKYTGSYDTMTKLFARTYYDLPNGPNGTEGDVYHDVLISAILNDDDDGVLSNGTPNIQSIVRSFAEHGIYIMSGATLTHQELAHQPSNTPVTVTANLAITESSFFQDIKLFYRSRNVTQGWDSVAMTDNGNFNFTAQLPGFPSFSIVDYYFKVYDFLGYSTYGFPNGFNTVYSSSQVTIPYQFAVGVKTSYKNDFETNTDGWIVGAPGDNATGGKWEVGKPVGTFYQSLPVQPGADHTTGSGRCLVTGNGTSTQANSDDVDNGITTVTTPTFDINSFIFPVIEYYRWYSNDRGQNGRSDAWQVQIRDTTTSIWITVENTFQSDYNWRRKVFNVREYLSSSRYIQVRFIAKDAVVTNLENSGQNTVEAALDDFSIYDMALSDLSVSTTNATTIAVYPNPANDKLNIAMSFESEGFLTLSDLTGRVIIRQGVEANSTTHTLNTSGIPAGQYLLSVQTEKLSEVKKVVITH